MTLIKGGGGGDLTKGGKRNGGNNMVEVEFEAGTTQRTSTKKARKTVKRR